MTDQPRRLPPIWLLGMANMPLGLTGGLMLLTMPQLLASHHVPEPVIAQMTTLALVPTFLAFLLGPIIDVKFSRRTYAVAATVLAAAGTVVAMTQSSNLALLGAAMFCAIMGAALNNVAIGGWFGSLVAKADDGKLGAWMVVANVAAFGLISIVGIGVLHAMPLPLAAALLAAPLAVPLVIYAFTPAPGPDQRLARESFAQFVRDLGALVRRPLVLQLLLLFAVPAASFALTNTLGGLGRDYHASENFVAFWGGSAAAVAGVFGSLLVPLLVKRLPSRSIYIAVGSIGALFTLSLIVLPHTPLMFGVAMIGQNVAQSAALALNSVIALQSLGKDNPFAATQFGLLVNAAGLPITYMQLLDGHAYGQGGLTSMYVVDGGLGLGACVVMALLLRWWAKGKVVAATS